MKPSSLFLAGVASLLPTQLAPLLAQTAPPAEVLAFQPPATPLVLSRTVWRSLRDGQEIMVRRRYEVRFSPYNGGYRLDGRLIDTAVAAPPPLALLAEIERTRPDAGIFPLHLDGHGRIISQQGRIAAGDSHRDAGDRARTILARSTMDSQARQQSEQLAQSILDSALGGSSWPSDLFSPDARSRQERRVLALGGGQQGEIEVSVDVGTPGKDGLPHSVERRVATRIEGSSRFSREVWTLAPSGAPSGTGN